MADVQGQPIASPPDTFAIALSLAKVGWHVFPVNLIPTTREDGTHVTDKRPLVRWLEGATTDPEQIATWWGADFPGAWIGVQAERTGIVIVDLDLPKKRKTKKGKVKTDGRDGLRNLTAADYKLPKTFHYKTRSGGRHHVYAAPKNRPLTIASNHPVPGVDIRAGHGLMVYYGPELVSRPKLAKAPDWSLLDAKATSAGQGSSADLEAWSARVPDGRQDSVVIAARKEVKKRGMGHDEMLTAVDRLVRLGSEGARGAATALAEARTVYLADYPEHARHWDNAVEGSIAHYGLPLHHIRMNKAERAAIRATNKASHSSVKTKDDAGDDHHPRVGQRLLDDGPLAEDIAAALQGIWAYGISDTDAHGGIGLMRWTGKRWKIPPAEQAKLGITEAVRNLLKVIEIEEHTMAVQRDDGKRLQLAQSLLSRSRVMAITGFVVGILAENAQIIDAQPHLLNTPSGVVDMRDLSLSPHDPALMMTKMTAASYDPDADMTLWLKALQALPAKTAAWMKYRMGQAAWGSPPDDDVMLILEGGGENGKTTVVHAPKVTLGDYAVRISDRVLASNPNDHPTELMELMGARYAIFEELAEGRQLNVKRLKDIVGTPEVTARRMRQDPVTFPATHSTMGTTNYLPIVAETDHGTWRRMLLVRFPYTFLAAGRPLRSDRDRRGDPRVRAQLQKPDAGVLRWLIEGAHDWHKAGQIMPPPPAKVLADTQAWREDADPVMGYVGERLEVIEGWAITCDELARDFNDWLERHEHRPWGSQTINTRFASHVTFSDVTRAPGRFGGSLRQSRPPLAFGATPANTKLWKGVRFQAPEPDAVPPSAEATEGILFADIVSRLEGPGAYEGGDD